MSYIRGIFLHVFTSILESSVIAVSESTLCKLLVSPFIISVYFRKVIILDCAIILKLISRVSFVLEEVQPFANWGILWYSISSDTSVIVVMPRCQSTLRRYCMFLFFLFGNVLICFWCNPCYPFWINFSHAKGL